MAFLIVPKLAILHLLNLSAVVGQTAQQSGPTPPKTRVKMPRHMHTPKIRGGDAID